MDILRGSLGKDGIPVQELRKHRFLGALNMLQGHGPIAGETTGGVAQLGERLNGIQEVRGSIPLTSIPVPARVTFAGGLKGPMYKPRE